MFWARRGLGVVSPANQLVRAKDRLNKANDPADITAEGSTLNIDIPGRVQEKWGWSCQRGPDECSCQAAGGPAGSDLHGEATDGSQSAEI